MVLSHRLRRTGRAVCQSQADNIHIQSDANRIMRQRGKAREAPESMRVKIPRQRDVRQASLGFHTHILRPRAQASATAINACRIFRKTVPINIHKQKDARQTMLETQTRILRQRGETRARASMNNHSKGAIQFAPMILTYLMRKKAGARVPASSACRKLLRITIHNQRDARRTARGTQTQTLRVRGEALAPASNT